MEEYLKQITRLPDVQKDMRTGETITQYWHMYFSDAHKGVLITENINNGISAFKIVPLGFVPEGSGAWYANSGTASTIDFLTTCMVWVRSLDAITLKNMLYEHINHTVTMQHQKATNPQKWFDEKRAEQERKNNPPKGLIID